MEQRAPRKPNWTMQAILCAGVVAWQSYDLATAVEARPTALLALQYLAFAGGLIGGVGALVMMARSASPRGWAAAGPAQGNESKLTR